MDLTESFINTPAPDEYAIFHRLCMARCDPINPDVSTSEQPTAWAQRLISTAKLLRLDGQFNSNLGISINLRSSFINGLPHELRAHARAESVKVHPNVGAEAAIEMIAVQCESVYIHLQLDRLTKGPSDPSAARRQLDRTPVPAPRTGNRVSQPQSNKQVSGRDEPIFWCNIHGSNRSHSTDRCHHQFRPNTAPYQGTGRSESYSAAQRPQGERRVQFNDESNTQRFPPPPPLPQSTRQVPNGNQSAPQPRTSFRPSNTAVNSGLSNSNKQHPNYQPPGQQQQVTHKGGGMKQPYLATALIADVSVKDYHSVPPPSHIQSFPNRHLDLYAQLLTVADVPEPAVAETFLSVTHTRLPASFTVSSSPPSSPSSPASQRVVLAAESPSVTPPPHPSPLSGFAVQEPQKVIPLDSDLPTPGTLFVPTGNSTTVTGEPSSTEPTSVWPIGFTVDNEDPVSAIAMLASAFTHDQLMSVNAYMQSLHHGHLIYFVNDPATPEQNFTVSDGISTFLPTKAMSDLTLPASGGSPSMRARSSQSPTGMVWTS